MLTERVIRRLILTYKLLSYFCLIPCDWNSKTRRLTKTNNNTKILINDVIIVVLSVIMVYFSTFVFIDMYFGLVEMKHGLLIGLIYSCFTFFWSLAISFRFFMDEFNYMIDNLFFMDEYFQGLTL